VAIQARGNWLRYFAQPVTYLGVATLVSIFAATCYLLVQDRHNGEEQARQQTENLAFVFEEAVARGFRSADDMALQFRRSYQRDPTGTDLVGWVRDPQIQNDLKFEYSIAGPDGVITTSSYRPAIGLSIAGRKHFQIQKNNVGDRLYVSEPLVAENSGRMAVFLTRRLTAADGSFNGVLSVWVDVIQFETFFRRLQLGPGGLVLLLHRDGYILAGGANGVARPDLTGKYFPQAHALAFSLKSDRGTYWNGGSALDKVERLVSFRRVEGFPLVAAVGIANSEIFGHAGRNAKIYLAIDSVVAIVILMAIGFGAAREKKLVSALAEVAHQAHHDGLTGLPNRLLFARHIREAMDRARGGCSTFNVLMIDLDHFKTINDTLGHASGDSLVRETARRLKSCVRKSDVVARVGGDEFAIVQADCGNQRENAEALASRILATVGEPFNLDGHQVIVQTTIGIALYPSDGDEVDTLFKNADLALYRAKAEGRNTFRFFEPQMDGVARDRYKVEVELRNARPTNDFEIHYQPVVAADTLQVQGYEALVRWVHPVHGYIVPDVFIPVAESTGLIVPLGAWVLNSACKDATHWPRRLKVAVNLSPIQFRRGDVVQTVAEALASSGLEPDRLELEITESVLLQKDETNAAKLRQLRSLGVAIVLDDFGTGYASLSYLRIFPFDKIKIDQSFVARMPTESSSAAIVCATVGLAKNLGISTVAEGVETIQQFELLRLAGCDEMQGYLFGKPRPVSELRSATIVGASDSAAA
jgi:diguanylate cyclase (GGDEF)-like protein